MDNRTKESSIALLKRLRDAYQSQLDTRVVEEINSVIALLESSCTCCSTRAPPEDWRVRTLKVLAEVVRLVTNISDFID